MTGSVTSRYSRQITCAPSCYIDDAVKMLFRLLECAGASNEPRIGRIGIGDL